MTEIKTYRIIYEGVDPRSEKYFNRYEITMTADEKPTLDSLITRKKIYQCFDGEIVKKFIVEDLS